MEEREMIDIEMKQDLIFFLKKLIKDIKNYQILSAEWEDQIMQVTNAIEICRGQPVYKTTANVRNEIHLKIIFNKKGE
jgi:hypothetical protein